MVPLSSGKSKQLNHTRPVISRGPNNGLPEKWLGCCAGLTHGVLSTCLWAMVPGWEWGAGRWTRHICTHLSTTVKVRHTLRIMSRVQATAAQIDPSSRGTLWAE